MDVLVWAKTHSFTRFSNIEATMHYLIVRRRTWRWWVAPAVLLAAAVLYGCDTLTEGETIALQPKEVTFRFEFNENQFTPGQPVTINARDAVDLGPELEDDGYGKDEVVSARITAAELRRVNPQFSLSMLSDFSLRLVSAGSETTVASQSSFSDGSTSSLQLGPTRDVENFVRQTSFSAEAQFTPGNLPDGDYVLTVTLELRIEVEGL